MLGPGSSAATSSRPPSAACAPPPAPTRDEDLALVRAAALGDRVAFETVVDRHGPALTRYARRAVTDPMDAEDLVQEALVSAWQSLDRFDGRSSLRTWLFGILVHKIGSARRRRRAVPVQDEVLDRPGPGDPLQAASDGELRRALEAALATLPERQRAVWLLVQVEGLSQAEVASALRTTPDAVRGLLARARRSLAERMGQWRA
ncbi:RNA polymerase sigma factor [Phycicoccus flavus]|uniref:RNA polymerase sigma factor n=1 Tax=Phycicoccus flavus TaxID=2502783 RepID=UPI000FEB8FB8|nr:RNA polymerase sigma factor [Phycicoccus flavus]NHA70139.1 RNA polymerase sigma factor [Phycicoccus flavus]